MNVESEVEDNANNLVPKYLITMHKLKKAEEERYKQKRDKKANNQNKAHLIQFQSLNSSNDLEKKNLEAIINHLTKQISAIIEKSKTTISNIQQCHEELEILRESESVKIFLNKKELKNLKKRKRNEEKEKEKENEEEKEENSEFEEDFVDTEIEKRMEVEFEKESEEELKKKRKTTRGDEDENEKNENEDITRELEDYDNRKCGEEDPSIQPDSRIQVHWRLENKWRVGTVKFWDMQEKMYQVTYDSDDDPEPVLEHLTGESREEWQFCLYNTRRRPKKSCMFFLLTYSFISFLCLAEVTSYVIIHLFIFFHLSLICLFFRKHQPVR